MDQHEEQRNDFLNPEGAEDRQRTRRIRVLSAVLMVSTFASCLIGGLIFSQLDPDWISNPIYILILIVLFFGGLAAQFVIRYVAGRASDQNEFPAPSAQLRMEPEWHEQPQVGAASANSNLHAHDWNDASDMPAESISSRLSSAFRQPQKSSPAKKPTMRFSGGLVVIGGILLGVFACAVARPFHMLEHALLVGLVTMPVAAVILYCCIRNDPAWPVALKDGLTIDTYPRSTYITYRGLAFFILAATFSGFILDLNQWLDSSDPQMQKFDIVEKKTTVHKGTTTYHAYVQSPYASPLPFSFGAEDIHLSASEYAATRPTVTQITLALHTGFFGMPWYEQHYTLSELQSATPTYQSQRFYDHPGLKEACTWRRDFDIHREIEDIPPNDYHRDFWPGGQPRSVEPHVHGQAHGLGHYTFANGQVYGDIPWKHGAKHGVFTLYREDGSREQTLSYKDGHLYGISEWYRLDGSVSASWLYFNEQSYFPVNVCKPFL